MKHLICLMAALLVLVAVASWIPAGLPVEDALFSPVVTASGITYAAENTDISARVYRIRDGELMGLFRLPRLVGQHSNTVTHLAALADRIYLLRQWDDGQLELLELSQTAKPIWAGNPSEIGIVTGLSASDGSFAITAVTNSGDIQVYTLSTKEGLMLTQLLPAPEIGHVVRARYESDYIQAELNTGETCRFSSSGSVELLDTPYEPEITLSQLRFGQWLLCKRDVLLGAVAAWLVIVLVVTVVTLISRRALRLATRLTAVCSGTLLLALAAGYGLLLVWSVHLSGPSSLIPLMLPAALAIATVWLLATVAVHCLLRRQTAPLMQLRQQMGQVADGNLTVDSASLAGRDELRLMHQSLQELCLSLSIRDYELDCTVRSYERFVPRDLTRLLQRANVSEISYGDNQRLMGCVGLFSICNRNEARADLDDGSFCAFVDHSYALMEQGMQAHSGVLLSGGLHLDSMEILFPDGAQSVRAGLQFLGQAKVHKNDTIPTPELFLLVHQTSFLYGVSGSQEKLFPYLSSSELEYLGRFTPQFHKAGVKIVVTERCRASLEESNLLSRYIGFITAADGSSALKLYEVLSAYPDVERNLRMRYDQRFQEALVLFYRDDFYLARNLFSALLRACPEDGIVRWYLFACEHFFHQEAGGAVDYQLFGISET